MTIIFILAVVLAGYGAFIALLALLGVWLGRVDRNHWLGRD